MCEQEISLTRRLGHIYSEVILVKINSSKNKQIN